MPALTPQNTASGVANARRSTSHGCALRLAGGALVRPFGHAQFPLSLRAGAGDCAHVARRPAAHSSGTSLGLSPHRTTFARRSAGGHRPMFRAGERVWTGSTLTRGRSVPVRVTVSPPSLAVAGRAAAACLSAVVQFGLPATGSITIREATRRVERGVQAGHSRVQVLLACGVLEKTAEGKIGGAVGRCEPGFFAEGRS